jgi:O-antigen ligase
MVSVAAAPRYSLAAIATLAGTPVVLGAGLVTVARPGVVLLGLAGVLAVAAMVLRIRWAVLCYVAIEPFADLIGAVHPAAIKAVGALLFVAWALRMVLDARPLALRHPGVYAAGTLILALLASLAASGVESHGIGVGIRYLSYIAVFAVLVDTIRSAGGDRLGFTRRIAAVFVVSCAASGMVGLIGFLADGGRAAGPLEDPNDFAFFLISAVPLAVWLARSPGRAGAWYAACASVLVLATLATLSRGAIVGLAAMVVLGVALRLVRLRVVVAGAAAVSLAVLAVWASAPDVVDRSLQEKQYVAAGNVDSRFSTWSVAAAMTLDRPLLGHGPGSFGTEARRYLPAGSADTTHYDVAHQMYLDVSSELGLIGLAAFLAVIGYGAFGAIRARRVPETRAMATGVVVALAGTLLAASFLSEQYYLPIWLLAAFGVALDPERTGTAISRKASS